MPPDVQSRSPDAHDMPIYDNAHPTNSSPPSTPGPDPTPVTTKPSTWRRLSHPPIPTFRPNIPNLRAALLGYLGEVELALRNKLGDLSSEQEERIRASSSSPSISGEGEGEDWNYSTASASGEGDSFDDDFGGDASAYGLGGFNNNSTYGAKTGSANAYTSSTSGPSASASGLRKRLEITQGGEGGGLRTTSYPPVSAESHHLKLLNHLSALREEALNYLPSLPSVAVPSMPIPVSMPLPSREWLRSLPSRLSMVDSGLGLESVYDEAFGIGRGRANGSEVGGEGKEKESEVDSGAIEGARKRVLELVHAVLPSEDWAGWERLGWEEQDEDIAYHRSGHGHAYGRDEGDQFTTGSQGGSGGGTGRWGDNDRRVRSASLERWKGDDEEEDEPEYLFPNRTPASAKAMARRRAVRSKSLGATSFPTVSATIRPRPIKLERVRSEPYSRVVGHSGDGAPFTHESGRSDAEEALVDDLDAEEDDEELEEDVTGEDQDQNEDDQDYIATHPEVTDTKLTALAAKKHKHKSGWEMGPSVQEALKRSNDGNNLINYDDLPAVWRNNEHLHTGYRFIPLHLKTGPVPLIKSAFKWHNETLNIHSHFIPTILILLCIPFIVYQSPLPNARPLDTAALVAYLLAATSCLFSSASWHVLSGCASKRWFEWGACVDYIGISWLIAASFGTVVYNGFYCQPKLVLLYCTTNALCGALGSYLPFQKWFNERRNKHLRISFFLVLSAAMFVPMLQLFYQHGFAKARVFVAPFGWSIATYLTGLVFYAFHFPECRWPGKFDRFGMSHQWWHAGIVLAIWLHYRALFVAHSVKYDYSCAAPGAGKSVAQVLEGWLGLATN